MILTIEWDLVSATSCRPRCAWGPCGCAHWPWCADRAPEDTTATNALERPAPPQPAAGRVQEQMLVSRLVSVRDPQTRRNHVGGTRGPPSRLTPALRSRLRPGLGRGQPGCPLSENRRRARLRGSLETENQWNAHKLKLGVLGLKSRKPDPHTSTSRVKAWAPEAVFQGPARGRFPPVRLAAHRH